MNLGDVRDLPCSSCDRASYGHACSWILLLIKSLGVKNRALMPLLANLGDFNVNTADLLSNNRF